MAKYQFSDSSEQIDILHPLAHLHWEQCPRPSQPVPNGAHCVLVGDKLYVGGGQADCARKYFSGELWVTSPDLKSWKVLSTPTRYYALVVFHSEVVLVGGFEFYLKETDKVFSQDENSEWKAKLPQTPVKCRNPSAISTENSEHLIVLNHSVSESQVMILTDNKWCIAKSNVVNCRDSSSFAVHKGNWYFVNSRECRDAPGEVFFCNIKELITAILSERKAEMPDVSPLWKRVWFPLRLCNPSYYKGYLICTLYDYERDTSSTDIYAYSPLTCSWIKVGDVSHCCTAGPYVLPSGDLLMMGGSQVFKGTLKMDTYDPDARITLRVLDKLEAAGIKLFGLSCELSDAILETAGVEDYSIEYDILPEQYAENFIYSWENGSPSRPPTWRSLFDILDELRLEGLREQIQRLLCNMKSLRELCLSTVTSILLQRPLQEPEKVCASLPGYIPTTLRQSITNQYKNITSLIIPPIS